MKALTLDLNTIPGFAADSLAQAVSGSDLIRVKELLAEGVRAEVSSAHLVAAAYGDLETLRLLVDQEANLRACDMEFRTAFELGHEFGHYAVVRFFQQFDANDLVNEEGTPRWLCPICWHWKCVGTFEDACDHYVTSTDLFGECFEFAEFENSAKELVERVEELVGNGVDLARKVASSRSDAGEIVKRVLHRGTWLFWRDRYDHLLKEVTVDVSGSLCDTSYTDFFALEAEEFIKSIEDDCENALKWLRRL